MGHIEPVRAQFMRSSSLETTYSADEFAATGLLAWYARLGTDVSVGSASADAASPCRTSAVDTCLLSCRSAMTTDRLL